MSGVTAACRPLVRAKTGVAVVAVGLIEVRDGSTTPRLRVAFGSELPFDYVRLHAAGE